MAKSATVEVTAAEPVGAVADYLKTLPPIMDDPNTYDNPEDIENRDVRTAEEANPEIGDDITPEEKTETDKPAPERDETGKFKKKEDGTAEAETTPEEKPDPIAALLEALGDDDRNAFEFARTLRDSTDPISLLAQQAEQAGLKQALLEKLGIPPEVLAQLNDPQQAAGIDPDYVPTGYEVALQPVIDKLAKFPESVREIAAPIAMEAVNAEISRMTPYIDATNIENQINNRMLSALQEMMGVTLPQVDRKAVMEALQDPKATYESAITKVIGDSFSKSVADYKQATKARPETPGAESEGVNLDDLPRDRKEFGITSGADTYRALFGGR